MTTSPHGIAIHPDVYARLRTHVLNRLAAKDHGFSDLNLHQTSVHCNGAALGHRPDEAEEAHHHEHYGPGGIRNHDYADRSWDPEQIATVLIECAEMDVPCEPQEALAADAFPIWRAAVDNLMTPPSVITRTTADQHVHLDPSMVAEWSGLVCPGGADCLAYPRLYDVRVERAHDDRVLSSGSHSVDSRALDIARCLLNAEEALAWVSMTSDDSFYAPRARDAGTRLRHAMTFIQPLLPEDTPTASASVPPPGEDHPLDLRSPQWAGFVEAKVEAVKDALRPIAIDPVEPELNAMAVAVVAMMIEERRAASAATHRLRTWVEAEVSDHYDPVISPTIHDDLRTVLGMPPADR
jgi:hypothetical protein